MGAALRRLRPPSSLASGGGKALGRARKAQQPVPDCAAEHLPSLDCLAACSAQHIIEQYESPCHIVKAKPPAQIAAGTQCSCAGCSPGSWARRHRAVGCWWRACSSSSSSAACGLGRSGCCGASVGCRLQRAMRHQKSLPRLVVSTRRRYSTCTAIRNATASSWRWPLVKCCVPSPRSCTTRTCRCTCKTSWVSAIPRRVERHWGMAGVPGAAQIAAHARGGLSVGVSRPAEILLPCSPRDSCPPPALARPVCACCRSERCRASPSSFAS